MLASKRDENSIQKYKIIKSLDGVKILDNIQVKFKSTKEVYKHPDLSFEVSLFKKMYDEDVVQQVIHHYKDLLSNKNLEKNYLFLYGQKATGKTFMILKILPQLFPSTDIEYIDMNKMLLLSHNFNDMETCIKYLSCIFMEGSNSQKLFIIDHLDCALPKVDSSEVVIATKRIKQQQMLSFFLDLIDSKKYCLLFIGRHYQNIESELASVSRVDKFVQITPPDFNKRKIAFGHIIHK